jgi:hypothetical protein
MNSQITDNRPFEQFGPFFEDFIRYATYEEETRIADLWRSADEITRRWEDEE